MNERPGPTEPAEPSEDLARRIRRAATAMTGAAESRHPVSNPSSGGGRLGATTPPPQPPSRRRLLAAAAAVALVAAGVGAFATLTDDDGDHEITDGSHSCESGEDLLALTVSSEHQDPDLIDGSYSVALTTPGGEVEFLNAPEEVVHEPSFSPSGDQVAVTWADGDYESAGPNSESIWVVDRRTGSSRPLTTGPDHTSPIWSPDGTSIAYVNVESDRAAVHVDLVPAHGGEPRRLAAIEEDGYTWPRIRWAPDGRSVIAWYEVRDEERVGATSHSEVARIGLDGTQELVAVVDERIRDVTVVPGGSEVLALVVSSVTSVYHHVAIDLETGDQRAVDGPPGTVRWSIDGQRLYFHGEGGDGHGMYRAHYDGQALAPYGDPVFNEFLADDFVVGPCDSEVPEGEPAADQPLVGTEWVLGPRTVVVRDMSPPDDCASPGCRRIQVTVNTPWEARGCSAFVGTLRGEDLTLDHEQPTDSGCTTVDDDLSNLWRPTSIAIEGDLLTVGFRSDHDEFSYEYTQTFGALYVGKPSEPATPPLVEGPKLEAVDPRVPVTTVPIPDVAPCSTIESFGARLAAASTVHEDPGSTSPTELATSSDLVVKGYLHDSDLGSSAIPDSMALVYLLVVDQVLVDRIGLDLDRGQVLSVPVSFDVSGEVVPTLGELGSVGFEENPVPVGDGVPAIAFLQSAQSTLVSEMAPLGPSSLAVGCPGGPISGLVGSGVEWQDLADLDALADAVRP